MAANKYISMSVIKRLPRYYRFLDNLNKDGITRISSKELSLKMGLTASQIRQDLNCFGGFGQQGYGYNVESLFNEIGRILGVDKKFKLILIGAGNLGRAIGTHMAFNSRGFDLVGIFDRNQSIIGEMIKGIPIRSIDTLDDFCKETQPVVAVLCIPSAQSEEIVDQLVHLGVKGFWNFTHFDINSKYPDVAVENVHLTDSIMTLSYQIMEKI